MMAAIRTSSEGRRPRHLIEDDATEHRARMHGAVLDGQPCRRLEASVHDLKPEDGEHADGAEDGREGPDDGGGCSWGARGVLRGDLAAATDQSQTDSRQTRGKGQPHSKTMATSACIGEAERG